MIAVGNILDEKYSIQPDFFKKISLYFEDKIKRDALAHLCLDPRIEISSWINIFYREIIFLYQWSAKRLIFNQGISNSLDYDKLEYEGVLSLLPKHGIATHILRRAVPFAACGLNVEIGFQDTILHEGRKIVSHIAHALHLQDRLSCNKESSITKVNKISKKEKWLIIVTGKKLTVEIIRSQVQGDVYGVTGRCALLLGNDEESKITYTNIIKHNLPLSCTKLKAYFLMDEFYNIWDYSHKKNYGNINKFDAIDRLHPSFIYCQDNIDVPEFIRGYRVIKCKSDGTIETLVGFSKDPLFNWPGDFLI